MKRLYTILLGHEIYEGGIDDMNSSAIWSPHGMVWTNEKKALAYLKDILRYNLETGKKKFSIKELYWE